MAKPINVLILNQISQNGLKRLPAERYQVGKDVANADAIMVRSADMHKMEIPASVQAIGRAGAGTNNIPVEEYTKAGVVVFNSPGANANAVKELVLCGMLLAARGVLPGIQWINQQSPSTPYADLNQLMEHHKKNFKGGELAGKTIGVVGLGAIGALVADIAIQLGMKVLGYDPALSVDAAWRVANQVEKQENITSLISRSDYVSLHLPVLENTRNLIDRKVINYFKTGAVLLNYSRDAIVDDNALLDGLNSGRLSCYVTDFPTPALLGHPKTILMPHIGASTVEAQRDVSIQMAEQIVDALNDKDVRNAVNFPPIDPNALPVVKPYLQLSENLGTIMAHLIDGRLQRVEVEYRGGDVAPHVTPLTVALLRGLLAPVLGRDAVNYVNAPLIASERGILVTQALNLTASEYTNLVSLRATTDQGEHLIAGTCFDGAEPRIVQIDNFRIDAVPSGTAVLISSRDVPGVVGRVGTILGANYVNIAEYRLGRTKAGDRAMSFVNLDNQVPEYAMKALRDLPEVLWVKQIVL
jgi:D-3-phosphoglycerate dehydrogenase